MKERRGLDTMTQIARVVDVLQNGLVEVEVRRMCACNHNCDGCSTHCRINDEHVKVVAKNDAGAAEGDNVVIQSKTSQILGIAAIVYIVPIMLFFIGYILSSGLGESTSVLIGVGAFLIGIIIAYLYSRHLKKTQKTEYIATKRV